MRGRSQALLEPKEINGHGQPAGLTLIAQSGECASRSGA